MNVVKVISLRYIKHILLFIFNNQIHIIQILSSLLAPYSSFLLLLVSGIQSLIKNQYRGF